MQRLIMSGILLGIGCTLQAQNSNFEVRKDTVTVNGDAVIRSKMPPAEQEQQFVFKKMGNPEKPVSKKQLDSAVYKYNNKIIPANQVDSITKGWKVVGIKLDVTKNPIEKIIYEASEKDVQESKNTVSIQHENLVHKWLDKSLPDLHLKDINGNVYDAGSLKGKVVVLNFWFVACSPCRQEMPELNKLVARYKGKNVVFLGLALDDEKGIQKFLQQNSFDYSIVGNTSELSYRTFGISSWPTHIVADKDGIIRMVEVGNTQENLNHLQVVLSEIIRD